MKNLKLITLSTALLATALLAGCAKAPVARYAPNMVLSNHLQSSLYSQINVGTVSAGKKDSNKIVCDMSRDIYLPEKLSYAQTIRRALQLQLRSANRLNLGSKNELSLKLSKVSYHLSAGRWNIVGDVTVNNNAPISVGSETRYQIAHTSECRAAANNFNGAVSDFVTKVLSTQTVLDELNRSSEIKK